MVNPSKLTEMFRGHMLEPFSDIFDFVGFSGEKK